jgi:hypothetical protein
MTMTRNPAAKMALKVKPNAAGARKKAATRKANGKKGRKS